MAKATNKEPLILNNPELKLAVISSNGRFFAVYNHDESDEAESVAETINGKTCDVFIMQEQHIRRLIELVISDFTDMIVKGVSDE